jgi:hypothetical protein
MPSATTHVLSPTVLSAQHRRLHRSRWGTAGHGAEPGRSCSAQYYSAQPAADPTVVAGRGPQRKLPGTTLPRHIYRGPTGTLAVSGRWERRLASWSTCQAGASISRLHWPWTWRSSRTRVDRRRSTRISEQSLGRLTGRVCSFLSKVTAGQLVHISDE